MRLLDEGDLRSLTTNAVAERAGVSIGTLYQYFGDKEALLDALLERELGDVSARVMALVEESVAKGESGVVRSIVTAVVGSYGGRNRVHRQLIAHSLGRGGGTGFGALYSQLVTTLATKSVPQPGKAPVKITPAQAFVQTYAIAGVLRNYAVADDPPPQAEIEEALTDMITGFYVRLANRSAA